MSYFLLITWSRRSTVGEFNAESLRLITFVVFLRHLKESYYVFLSFLTCKCCYDVGYSCKNSAIASHNDVHAFESEPCRLFKLNLYAVFYSFFYSVFPVTLMRAGLSYMGMPALCTQRCTCKKHS